MNQKGLEYEHTEDEITIDLGELCRAILKKAPVIILCAVIFAVLALIGTKFFITPMYTSETKVYVLSRQSDANNVVTYNDLQMGAKLTQDYSELVKSRPVMEHTIKTLKLDTTVNGLKDAITVSTASDETRILSISVEYSDPELARDIADVVRESASIQITEIMDAEAVNVVETANLPHNPSSPSLKKNVMLGGILGAILAIAVVVILYMLDDTIKNVDDVEKYLGLGVLTSIPITEAERQQSKKHRKKTGKKGMK